MRAGLFWHNKTLMEQLEFAVQMQRAIELGVTGKAMDDMYHVFTHHTMGARAMNARLRLWSGLE